MAVDRVQIQDVLSSQIPSYVQDDFPLLLNFLEEYYVSQETQGGVLDLIENLDQYVRVEELANLKTEAKLGADIDTESTSILLSADTNFTHQFPKTNGLIQIDDEIIKYSTKTDTTLEGCIRGFSGVTEYINTLVPDKQTFTTTTVEEHENGATVKNLSVLFLQEFFTKLKTQVAPGFEDRTLASNLNKKNFITGADSFYKSKGTDESFKILFKSIYGVDVDILKPYESLIRPSDANYVVSQDYIVEKYIGDPLKLNNRTIFQNSTNARGTVTKVEKLNVDGDFYQISIDTGYQRDIDVDGTIYGKFEPNSKTLLINNVSVGSTIIDVDSTVDFASSGSLSMIDDNGDEQLINYTDKNLTQFIGLTTTTTNFTKGIDVRNNDYSFANIGIGSDNQIRVRILSTLQSIEYTNDNFGLKKGDRISLKTIGVEDNSFKTDWFYNVKSKLDVKNLTLTNPGNNIYTISFFEKHNLIVGYKIELTDLLLNTIYSGEVSSIDSDTQLNVKMVNAIPSNTLSNNFSLENQLLKGNSNELPIDTINSNVLNSYKKNGSYLLASNSVPNYQDEIRCDDKVFTFSGSANFDIIKISSASDHGLYTGDAVYYNYSRVSTASTTGGQTFIDTTTDGFSDVDEGIYFIKREDAFNVKLAKSKADLANNKFITPTGTVTNNKFTYYPFFEKPITGQKIFREINEPEQEAGVFTTKPGKIGVLINGVEIDNYKSSDVIFYGGIKSFEITSPGKNYDVINPPVVSVTDSAGTGATGSVSVSGSVSELRIIDKGFDYLETPVVTIEGGNPDVPAKAEVNLIEIDHSISFNAGVSFNNIDGGVDLTNNIVGFLTFHNLRDIEQVTYNTTKNPVVGLGTNQVYFAKVVDGTRIKLFSTFDDASIGINTVSLTGLGNGQQTFSTVERKKVVSNVIISDPGSGYKNQKRTILSTGISTSLNTFTITNHGYETNDIVQYTPNGTAITGISSETDYFVRKIDDDNFNLHEVGTGSLEKRYYIDNNIVLDIIKLGSGSFNYKPITVTVSGSVGVNTSFGQNIDCTLQPIIRGSITSADVQSEGVGYGSSEILNFDRKPVVSLESGELAQLTPIVVNGSIKEVVVNQGGSGFNSPPELIISDGKYCKLTPIIINGSITSVIVVSGGIDYKNDSLITIVPSGTDGSIDANINQWVVNKFEQKFNKLTDDDCIITSGSIDNTTQLAHLYAPRNLRSIVYGKKSNAEPQYNHPDLTIEFGLETDSKYHSPIIGWAYDGAPIYGPFGYDKPNGGGVRRMKSGYVSVTKPNRPPLNLYPLGFFVEDFDYIGTGDLNESNGRFCVTPDYPNGKFVYFSTISQSPDGTGPFKNFKRPQFPYLIGNSFQHKQNDFNFKKVSNHVDYDLVQNNWRRITTPYKINSKFGGYDYIFNSNNVKEQIVEVTATSKGSVDSVGIFTGGSNYKINDRVVFKGDTTGKTARGIINKIGGKRVDFVDIATTTFTNIEFTNAGASNKFVGFMTSPHNLSNNTRFKISGLTDFYPGLDKYYNIGINTGSYVLLDDVDTVANTGIVTFFSVGGAFQYPFMRPNDIIKIESEEVKVLNSDALNNRVRVLRAQNGTTGAAHTGNVKLFQDPRSFSINVGTLKTTRILKTNTEHYFDPNEAVGVGSLTTVGAGKTIVFSNPGAGATNIFVPEQQIYIPNHTFKVNDTVTYKTNTGDSIEVWNGGSGIAKTSLTNFSTLFVAPFDNTFIGLSSTRIGLTTSGYRGILDSTIGLFYFTGVGTSNYHSFVTNFDNVASAKAERTNVTVSTASTHGLRKDDKVLFSLNPKNETTIIVKYNNFNRRIVFDPQTFAASAVNTIDNTIGVATNTFKTGDKIIHTSNSPSGGLVNEKMYYVISDSPTTIKFVENKFELNSIKPNFVNITTAGIGTISKINPSVTASTNLKFDLSDSSLSFISNSIKYPAFEMAIYTDTLFVNQYLTSNGENEFNVKTDGVVGVDGQLTININETPPALFYKFNIVNESFIFDEKKVVIDSDVISNNSIFKSSSILDGNYTITGVGLTTFNFDLDNTSLITSYSRTTADAEYTTTSINALGSIKNVDLVDNNYGYETLPGISSIKTGIGTGAILFAESQSIGKIQNQKFKSNNIGWNYPTDKTLKPTANLPEIVEVNPLASFERIGITTSGKDYLVPPNLIVRDGFTGDIVDCDLEFELGDTEVNIITNSRGFYPTTPRIIATRNSNGFDIGSITVNGKTIRLGLTNQFNSNSEYPFSIGNKLYVEGVNIGIGSTGRGYNSEQYKHKLFEIVGVQTNPGGAGAYVEYSLEDDLSSTEIPGNVLSLNSARVIPESHLPVFKPILGKNKFLQDETVRWNSKNGIVDDYNNETDIVKIKTTDDLNINDLVIGDSSKTRGVVIKKFDFIADIRTGAGTTINYGWSRDTGVLNDSLQRMPDNNYYQRFSYSLKSTIPFDQWDNTVGSLNHTAGFKKFSDLQIESESESNLTPVVNDTEMSFIVDCIGEGDLNCYYDFDLARENLFDVNGETLSDTVFFENVVLTDFFESTGNRVLSVDDVSGLFNSNERAEAFASISTFDPGVKFVKSLFYVQDSTFTDERQFQVSTAIVDDDFGYLTSYGIIHTFPDLGFFDLAITDNDFDFQFHPTKFTINNYFVSSFSFAFEPTKTGAAVTSFGNIIDYESQEVNVSTGTTTNIVSVGTSYRSLKVMNLLVTGDEYHFAELNIVHNGTDVSFVEYNNIDEDDNILYGDSGIGTYSAEISGSDVLLKFHPNTGIAATSYSQIVNTARGNTIPGITTMNTARIGSAYTSIASSGSPTAHVVSSYDTIDASENYSASYQIITVEDTSNNHHEMFEIGVVNSTTIPTQGISPFGIVETDLSLGTVGIATTGNLVQVTYTPNPGIAVEVRSFFVDLREISPDNITDNQIDLNDGLLRAQTGNYFGTKNEIRTSFNLTHRGDPIFERQFDGSSTSIVNTTSNQISLPNHFFQSGEAIKYTVTGTDQRIGIVTTNFGGSVGSTSVLPTDLFVIKVNDAQIGFATSPTDAQAINPTFIELDSVGVGNSHFITATKQTTKMLVSVDNMIQAPISNTGIAATLSEDVVFQTRFGTSGITSISSNDIIKIDDEFMRVTSVTGTGTTLFVQRPILGTEIGIHSVGATIEKFVGNYTVTNNVLNFVSAPFGNIPIGTSTNPPDERDFSGISTNSTFSGRVFTKRGVESSTNETYSKNFVFDDISHQFTGIASEFTLKSDGQNVSGISSNTILLVNNIFQTPQGVQSLEIGSYQNSESSGVSTVTFIAGLGSVTGYDQNAGGLPIGGMIVSVGSVEGAGYQPLIGAGGTAVVSSAGTITSVSIGNSGSGYRTGVVTSYTVGVQTYFGVVPILEHVGTAVITDGHVSSVNITNPGSGYTNTNAPVVVIDKPLNYSNIPLVYSSSSSGVGTEATIDIIVGQGSSVIGFEINDFGYAFKRGDILTVPVGGALGIPTDPSITFSEFQISIQDTYSDSFNGYSPGEFQVFDRIDNLFDGVKKVFPLTLQGQPISIRASRDSNIEVDQTLLVFINDILQVPGESYTFEGGSQITFNEAPEGPNSGVPDGDTSRILFYKGGGDSDVTFTDILQTVKIGDTVELNADIDGGQSIIFDQNKRVITGITTIDAVKTNAYAGPGLANNRTVTRPLTWCKQTIDRRINGQFVGKDREKYEPSIFPAAYLTSSVSVASTEAYVDNVRPLFNTANESSNRSFQNSVTLISQNASNQATATATVSTGGTISSITLTDGGAGYDFTPTVTIAAPSGITTHQATATASVTAGVVTSVTITGIGTDYATQPLVLIEPPKINKEVINVLSYSGDNGVIVGVGSTNVGAQKQLFFDLFIPTDSFMRDASVVGTAITVSGIQSGDIVVVKDTFLSIGSTFASAVGVATTNLDCVYQVGSASTEMVTVFTENSSGITTAVTRIKCNVDTFGAGIAHTIRPFMGNYSWGIIDFAERTNTKTFDAFNKNGVIGISTSALVQRTNPLRFKNYT